MLLLPLFDVEQQERDQLTEQDIAQRLINEAASKRSAAVKSNDMQAAKVSQVMLDSGNDKLNETMKPLVDIRIRIDNQVAECTDNSYGYEKV